MATLGTVALVVLLSLLAAGARAQSDQLSPTDRQASAEDMSKLQDWGRRQGEDWLRQSLGLDLDRLQLHWDPHTYGLSFAAPPPPPVRADDRLPLAPAEDEHGSVWSLRLEQTQGLERLLRESESLEDLPFSVEVSGKVYALRWIRTRMVVPFSWRDEWRAEATYPVTLGFRRGSLWRSLGLGQQLSLRSDLRSKLGQNQWEAGLGTGWSSAWFGTWDLDYDIRKNYGAGDDEAVHWLKASRAF